MTNQERQSEVTSTFASSSKQQDLNILTLPQDLITDYSSGVQIVDYRASRESSKQQVNLSMNTFSFLLEGHKEVINDTATIAISNADFLIMKAGKCLMTEKFASSTEAYRSILLFFPNEAVFQFSRKYSLNLTKEVAPKTIQSISYDQYLRSFVESLVELDNRSAETKNKLLQVKFEELMLYLTDLLGADFLSSLMRDMDPHNFHFLNVVENNKLNKLTLNELAFLSNMSLSTFKREFEKHFKESPSKWFQEQLLDYAAFLLKNEVKRPSDIYQEIGYDSLTNFIQAFKIQFGKTPKQYQSD
jgi:AraC-like DNA-binding protein